ncbi:MAG TPA: malic enzyme-like NAD(P)-binding protein [Miltoncostaeaceae bacterium]|nr:malic enzyme-like NAD(P)-binding protein [Miltoncostaeaceae bacterium]
MSESSSSLTLRTTVPATVGTFGRVTAAISDAGGRLGGVDIVRSTKTDVTRDYTVYVPSDEVGAAVVAAVEAVEGVRVEEVRNRVLTLHEGGVVGMRNRMPLTSRDDLSMAYTPGVARVCMAIHHDFEQAWEYTIKANSVMVVSDGSSVVGLGDLGADASLPACEAKCLFLRELAGIDAFPLPVDARDPEAIIEAVALCSSVFAGIHLSDISAPRCFQIQTGLAARLDIPVFHDDQQGTAVAVLAALRNGLAVTGVAPGQARVVVAGEGPGGIATAALLRAAGVGEVVADATLPDTRGAHALVTFDGVRVGPADVPAGAIVFALGAPQPEIAAVARVYGDALPGSANQINSAIAFPGIWRGALACRASEITDAMLLAAAGAIADAARDEEGTVGADLVVPSPLSRDLVESVAEAVRAAAVDGGVARVGAGTH